MLWKWGYSSYDQDDRLRVSDVRKPPPPWRLTGVYAVGNLHYVGYAPDSDLILVVSSTGRSVMDCLAGERIARCYDEDFELDEETLICRGIDPIPNDIRVAGLQGGQLTTTTQDGWEMMRDEYGWFDPFIFIRKPGGGSTKIAWITACSLRAFGFSETGKSFVIATSCDLTVFNRD